ncbi:MAG: acyl-[ACP]--phospholipid O-acyltransferase [Rickettsiaceae bacterium]|nr:acyl-[ACP]--phospholipid O-acyltransferase [Rickettsiaceae bacterium]
MICKQTTLFKDIRFLPIFLVQFFGCLNDSILKNALIILVTYKISAELNYSPYLLVMSANIIFITPFLLFASIAGQIADKYERTTVVKIIKFAEVFIILLAIYGFYHVNLLILFSCVGLMGIHSTFFGPIKYSVLPDHMKKDELLSANGLIEAGTFLAILLGTMLGNLYNFNSHIVITLSVLAASIGLISSFFMPKSNNFTPDMKINYNLWQETLNMMRYALAKNNIYLSILGISWFWFIGVAFIAQIPALAKNILAADENVTNLFLAVFSIGVGTGAFICNKIFQSKITTKYVFLASLGITLCGIDLYFATNIASIHYETETLRTIWQFLSNKHSWRIIIDLFLLSAISGIYVVPLFAVMQYFTVSNYRSRVIATNNFINALFMISSTAFLSLLFLFGSNIPTAILIISLLNLVISIYIYCLIPKSIIIPMVIWRKLFKFLIGSLYNVEVKGLENFGKAGKKAVIIANHLSYLDPPLIATYIPETIKFAINTHIAKEWWIRPFLKIIKTYPIDTTSSLAIKTLITEVKKNHKIAIFPEGRISSTGSLMKIYEGPGMIADKANASLLPIRIDGTQFTIFSKNRKNIEASWFPFKRKITITILPPVKFIPETEISGKERRKYITDKLYDVMSNMLFLSSNYQKTIMNSFIEASKLYGNKRIIIQDADNNEAKYHSILFKTFILSNLVKKQTDNYRNIGIMLPNSNATFLTFLALQSIGKVTAMINFTSGVNNIIVSCRSAAINIIFTSRKFVEKASFEQLIISLKKAGIKIIFLEDIRKNLTLFVKVKSFIGALFPQTYYNIICPQQNSQELAVILFTSGTENIPKAVALSHNNIQANRNQVLARIDIKPYDVAFNSLPMFHSFGLTTSLIMVLNGTKVYFYPNPLHYRIIPEIIYYIGATIMFSTDTFLGNYAQYAHPYDLHTLRYVIAGAEKVKDKTRQIWSEKFGIRIFEGYGVTEASPVLSFNNPMYNKVGSVGKLLPNIEYFLQPVEGISKGGRLCIKGPNIMLGYITSDYPGVILPTRMEQLGEGWYDTGDIVAVDQEGFITILGREKRFAKIAGEMISLTAVEQLLSKADPLHAHAVISVEDNKKGEKIIAFTTNKSLCKNALVQVIHQMQLSELNIPKEIIYIDVVPMLASGKIDYKTLESKVK